jgi:V/A-type H+-transporting ATPase subunit C
MIHIPAHAVSSHDRRYAYASGRTRALETTLLGRQRLDRIAEAADGDEVLRLLADTAYAAHLDEAEDSGPQVFLVNEERRLLDLVDSLSLDRDVSDIIRLFHDFHNVKVALREKVSERDLGDLYSDLGRFEKDAIAGAVKHDVLGSLPDLLAPAVRDALSAYEAGGDPGAGDAILDRAMFAHFLRVTAGYGSPFMTTIVRTRIDLANIRAFLRARYLGLDARALGGILVEGGLARTADFHETYQAPLEEVLARFAFSPYRRLIETGGTAGEKEGSFVPMERGIDNALLSLLKVTRYFTFGLEIVISYALRRQIEIKVLRLVFAGKEGGMAPDLIKERIPDAD